MKHQRQRRIQFQRRAPCDTQRPSAVEAFPTKGFGEIQHHACAGSGGLVTEPTVTASDLTGDGDHGTVQRHRDRVSVQPFVVKDRMNQTS